jgi:hypothetical protein
MQQKYILKKEYYYLYQDDIQQEIQPIEFWQKLNIPVERIIEDVNIDYSVHTEGVTISVKINRQSDFVFESDIIDHAELYELISKKLKPL